MTTQAQLTADEIGDRGEAIYQERLRKQVEPGNLGRYLSLDIESDDYEIGTGHMETIKKLLARRPDAIAYTILIGYPATGAIGHRLLPNAENV